MGRGNDDDDDDLLPRSDGIVVGGDEGAQSGDDSGSETESGSEESEDETRTRSPSFLTLGDGDFSYSLDLARYLRGGSVMAGGDGGVSGRPSVAARRIGITATGLDTSERLRAKYRDVDSILRMLRSTCAATTGGGFRRGGRGGRDGGPPGCPNDEGGRKRTRGNDGSQQQRQAASSSASRIGEGDTTCTPDDDEDEDRGQRHVEVKVSDDDEGSGPSSSLMNGGGGADVGAIRERVSMDRDASTKNPPPTDGEPGDGSSSSLHDPAGDDDRCIISLSVHHGVDAIVVPGTTTVTGAVPPLLPRHEHVIFNHPHLGTEDAELHRSFVSHLLHSASNHWLVLPRGDDDDDGDDRGGRERRRRRRRGGVFHLTLVRGQCERWDVLKSAERHDLVLLHRSPFRPPPPPPPSPLDDAGAGPTTAGGGGRRRRGGRTKDGAAATTAERPVSYYQTRRHQSGRGFARRRPPGGSETLTFCLRRDVGWWRQAQGGDDDLSLLPWYRRRRGTGAGRGDAEDAGEEERKFPCPHCTRSFREGRSLRDHVRSVHGQQKPQDDPDADDGGGGGSGGEGGRGVYTCEYCRRMEEESESSSHSSPSTRPAPPRTFTSADALAQHVRAKHTGVHADVTATARPDWWRGGDDDAAEEGGIPRGCAAAEGGRTGRRASPDPPGHLPAADVTGGGMGRVCGCEVCGVRFTTPGVLGLTREVHERMLRPSDVEEEGGEPHGDSVERCPSSSSAVAANSRPCYSCRRCRRGGFRELRAVQQHENACFSSEIK